MTSFISVLFLEGSKRMKDIYVKDSFHTPKKRKWKKWLLISLIALFVIAFGVCVGISIHVGNTMTHPEKKPIEETPSDHGMEYDDIEFLSADGETDLSGWVIHPEEEAQMTVIFGHGYKGNRYEDHIPFFEIADGLLERGYRVVFFDFRYAGESGGDMSTVGAKEQLDMLGAVDYIAEEYDEPISLLGFSMGGSAAILTASQTDKVVSVVSDSAFSDLEDYLKVNLPVWSDLPNFPFTPMILTIMPLITDLDPKEASPISVLDDVAPRPILFIHNEGDTSIPYEESEMMYDKHPDEFSFWLAEGDGHVEVFKQNKEEYIERLDAFFLEALEEIE